MTSVIRFVVGNGMGKPIQTRRNVCYHLDSVLLVLLTCYLVASTRCIGFAPGATDWLCQSVSGTVPHIHIMWNVNYRDRPFMKEVWRHRWVNRSNTLLSIWVPDSSNSMLSEMGFHSPRRKRCLRASRRHFFASWCARGRHKESTRQKTCDSSRNRFWFGCRHNSSSQLIQEQYSLYCSRYQFERVRDDWKYSGSEPRKCNQTTLLCVRIGCLYTHTVRSYLGRHHSFQPPPGSGSTRNDRCDSFQPTLRRDRRRRNDENWNNSKLGRRCSWSKDSRWVRFSFQIFHGRVSAFCYLLMIFILCWQVASHFI